MKKIETVIISDEQLEPDYDLKYRLDPEDTIQMEKIVKYFMTIIRSSFEYRILIDNLKTKLDIDTCSFYKGYSITNGLTIEFHHSVFKLRHIVETVVRKQLMKNDGYVYEHDVAKEVTMLHYQFKVGLTPLNPTAHQLADIGKLKIHPDLVIGDWREFYSEYKEYMSQDVLNVYDDYVDESLQNDLSKYPEILQRKKIHIEASNKKLITEQTLNNMLISEKISNITNEGIQKLFSEKKE